MICTAVCDNFRRGVGWDSWVDAGVDWVGPGVSPRMQGRDDLIINAERDG